MSNEIAKLLNTEVANVLGQKNVEGFEKAFIISTAMVQLNELLTPEYMKPIMAMQGNRLGFVTDMDKKGGYPESTVKKCLIEAVLFGLQPYNNQFNIIAGNMYPTKEGCGAILAKEPNLSYDIVCDIKNINATKTSALVEATINWKHGSVSKTKVVPIPIKIDTYASVDSIIGKATRKARAWLISTITGVEITDGEISDAIPIRENETQPNPEINRLKLLIEQATKVEDLISYEPHVKALNDEDLTAIYRQKSSEF